MKICHINLAKGFRGGERQTLLLIEALAKNNIKQQVVIRHNSPLNEYLTELNCDVIQIRKPFWTSLFFTKIDADIIHAHEAKASQLAWLNYKLNKIPYIITRRILKQPKSSWLNRQIYHSAIQVIALSSAIKSNLLAIMDNHKIEIIPSMYASLASVTKTVNQIKKEFDGKFLIGHIGALVNKDKGQFYLIEAAKKLVKTHREIHFLLVGSGKDEEELKQQAKNLKNITFVGFVKNVGDYLNSFDLFTFPSLQEGFGSVLLDVIQVEVPIIASKIGGIPDIIQHNENGFLISSANSDELIDAIIKLYTNQEKANTLAKTAKKGLGQYSPAKVGASYLAIYKNSLNHS